MQRVGKILASLVFASGLVAADAALAFGAQGGFGGGWGVGWRPDYAYAYPYDYGYGPPGYPPPLGPAVSSYCAAQTQICMLRAPRAVGSGCSCRTARGVVSGPPPQ
jgi:hypothetical protein